MSEDTVDWPGERQPTHLEIERAHEIAEVAVQREFKRGLLAKGTAQVNAYKPSIVLDNDLLHTLDFGADAADDYVSQSEYPYPLVFLLDLPQPLPKETVAHYKNAFVPLSQQHVYIRDVIKHVDLRNVKAPYLEPALACLGLCMSSDSCSSPESSRDGASNAGDLFHTARIIWSVIVECDNRETRQSECIIASLLLMTYGFLTADTSACTQSSSFISYTGVMVRRIHITDYWAHFDSHQNWAVGPSFQNLDLSALMSWMLLLDVVGALHLNTSNEFHTNELFFKMPKSHYNLGEIYIHFVVEEKPLQPDVVADDDALLILLALCLDVVATQRVYEDSRYFNSEDQCGGQASTRPAAQFQLAQRMPSHLLPFSPLAEYAMVMSKLRRALDRWGERFQTAVPGTVRALFHFVKVCAHWSTVLMLPQITGYLPASMVATPMTHQQLSRVNPPPDEALRHAWLVLDNVNVQGLESATACPVWLPVVTHMASLVVWRTLRPPQADQGNFGSLRVLNVFKTELEHMFWPCASHMAAHLNSLMHAS